MKRLLTVFALAALTFTSVESKAQAFDKSSKLITIGVGGADMFHIPVGYTYYTGFYSPLTAQLYVQGEFAVHKYVGVGFTTGIGGRPGTLAYYGGGFGYYGGYRSEFNIPIGAIANFHFYQLIADKAKKDIHGDKLDIYAGLSLGTGIAIHPSDAYYGTSNDVLFFVGPQVGVRYYFKPTIAVNAELGYGKTFINAGITFKLGGSSSKKK
jgi:hypothetical protein